MSTKNHKDYFDSLFQRDPKIASSKFLKASYLETPIGPMIAVADEKFLYLLEFIAPRNLEREMERLWRNTGAAITYGDSKPIESIKTELSKYFEGTLTHFNTPIQHLGTVFQKSVWHELQKIPYGETRSYKDIANTLGKPTAYRAVAQANGSNQLTIITPCHRVINSNGEIGGYGGGIPQKQYLLNLEGGNF